MTWLLKYWPIIGSLVGLLFNAGCLWAVWSLRQLARSEVNAIVSAAVAKLDAADTKAADMIDEHDTRLTKLEEALNHLPQRADTDRIERALADLGKTMAATNATLAGVKEANVATQNSVDRLYRYQLEKGS